jgi:hypothetical protein
MRVKIGSSLALVTLLGLVVHSGEARADFAQCSTPLSACTATSSGCCNMTVTSATAGGDKPILIAMDRCHAPLGSGTLGPPGSGAPRVETALSTIQRVGSAVLVTMPASHSWSNGTILRIASTSNSALHGTFKIKTGTNCTIGSSGGSCTNAQFEYSTTSSGAIGPLAGGLVLSYSGGQGWCVESPGSDSARIGGSTADNGMLRTYGLVYRLMQQGIPVYWLVNPTKSIIALNDGQNAASQSYLASDVDLWVLTNDLSAPPTSGVALTACGAGCTQPVHRLRSSDLLPFNDSYRYKELPLRGGAFLIAAEDRAKFNAFWKRTGAYSSLSATKYNWTSGASGIDLYEVDASAKIVYQDFTNGDGTSAVPWTVINAAPLAVKIDYEPPRIACLGCGDNVAQSWLEAAGLRDPATDASCETGEFVPSDATYCVLDDTDVANGTLVAGGFSWLWMLGYNDNNPCADSAEKAVFDKIRDFMTSVPAIRNAGHGIFLDDSIKVAEGCANKQLLGLNQATDGLLLASSGNAEPFILRYPNNLFMQFGDVAPAIASGTVKGWSYYKSGGGVGYQTPFNAATSSLRRLATIDRSDTNNEFCVQHATSVLCDSFTPSATTGDLMDVAAYARFNNNFNNGLAYYLPGNQLNNSGNTAELRMLLNSLIALPDETFTNSPTTIEVARSSPIVATAADGTQNVFQGTYEHYDPVPSIPKATTSGGLSRFTFPYTLGHLRMIPVGSFQACSGAGCDTGNGTRTAINSLSGAIFDAADHIPPVATGGCTNTFNGSCRTVFTTLQPGRLPPPVMFHTNNVNATTPNAPTNLGVTLASNLTQTERETLISRVLAGRKDASNNWVPKLGGVDRSTVAVIEASPIAGSTGRPTMAYFGATDGMLHAVCVTTGGGCDEVGRELWAYIPRTVLPDLRQSTARVDGSPHVIDAYGDFDNNGTNAWATILLFHTGTGRMTADNVVPAVYAIDITTPSNPKVLWEYSVTDVGARQAVDMGVGLNITAGKISTNETVAFVQTNQGGTGGAASVITAINVETGAEFWQFGDLYPGVRTGGHEGTPISGVPGGAVGLDTNVDGKIDKVVYGDLYGDVFVRAASTGVGQNGDVTTGNARPLLRIATDYHPIGVPPAILDRNGVQYAAFVTGGYADTQSTLWRGENEATRPTQFVFAVTTAYTGTTSLTDSSGGTNVPIKFNLDSNTEGGFAQLTVVGNELFVTTDTSNINDYAFGTSSSPTGKVYRMDFGAATPTAGTTVIVASGAGSIFNAGTTLINASGAYGEKLGTDAAGTTGTAIDPMASTNKLRRALWLRTE